MNFTGRLKTYILQELKTHNYKNICLVANIPSKEMKALASTPSKETNYMHCMFQLHAYTVILKNKQQNFIHEH